MSNKEKPVSNKIKNTDEKMMKVVSHVLLIVLCVFCVGSFLLVLGSSFQSESEIQKIGYRMIPHEFSLEAYKAVFMSPGMILDSYMVTIITTVVGTIIGLCISASAGYVISRKNYRYRKILSFFIFFTMLFNGGLVPTYILMTQWLHLKNTIWALILPLVVNAWYIILMRGFFQGIPDSIMEAARIDGASELRIFFGIVLPLSKPVLATIALFYALAYWNDWYQSLLYIDNQKLYKLQYLLMQILKKSQFLNSAAGQAVMGTGASTADMPTLNLRMAMCVVAVGPLLIAFPFFQKYFVKGITVGSVKG
ncbi:MAG: carbohydrate ABC transporter permease [Firmicutes bacterium]|jgi:putative aldouronate transport system permease protein|nr:carbohydrate ABC transporter permease [Bacillota bacterium]